MFGSNRTRGACKFSRVLSVPRTGIFRLKTSLSYSSSLVSLIYDYQQNHCCFQPPSLICFISLPMVYYPIIADGLVPHLCLLVMGIQACITSNLCRFIPNRAPGGSSGLTDSSLTAAIINASVLDGRHEFYSNVLLFFQCFCFLTLFYMTQFSAATKNYFNNRKINDYFFRLVD